MPVPAGEIVKMLWIASPGGLRANAIRPFPPGNVAFALGESANA
jgi:hypothetical protein